MIFAVSEKSKKKFLGIDSLMDDMYNRHNTRGNNENDYADS